MRMLLQKYTCNFQNISENVIWILGQEKLHICKTPAENRYPLFLHINDGNIIERTWPDWDRPCMMWTSFTVPSCPNTWPCQSQLRKHRRPRPRQLGLARPDLDSLL